MGLIPDNFIFFHPSAQKPWRRTDSLLPPSLSVRDGTVGGNDDTGAARGGDAGLNERVGLASEWGKGWSGNT